MMSFIKNNKYDILLFGLIIILFFLNAYNLTFNFKPSLIHQWRQSDCLSITKNYFEEGMAFLQPKIHWQGTKDGNAVSEMPVINYTVAALWKIFGQQEGIYRMFNYIIYLISIVVLFKTFNFYKIPQLIRFLFISVLLTSPLLVYYSYNFLADVPAFSLALIAFCLFFKFYQKNKKYLFYISLFLACLAVLLKASAAVPLSIIIIFWLIDFFDLDKKFNTRKLSLPKSISFVCIVVVISIIFLWYSFAKNYNLKNKSGVFLIGILPIWEMTDKEIFAKLSGLFSDQLPVYLNRPMLFSFFVSLIYVGFNLKYLDVFLKFSFCISVFFFLAFIVLFFQVFDVHDYYLINLMILPVVTMFCLAQIFTNREVKFGLNKWITTTIIICIGFNALYSAAFYRLRTIKDDKICHWYPFFNMKEKDKQGLDMWMYSKTMGVLETITPDLRRIGINRKDIFINVGDMTFNASLYLIDQKGYTLSPDDFSKDTTWKTRCNFYGCKYFLLSDTVFKDSLSYKLIQNDLEMVFKRNRVEIYKIKKL